MQWSHLSPSHNALHLNTQITTGDTNPGVTYSYLQTFIEKYISKENQVRATALSCFGGGIHHLAFNLPNFCASTDTNFNWPPGTKKMSSWAISARTFQELDEETFQKLSKFIAIHKINQRLTQVDRFFKTATGAEKKKFLQLLQCEWQPL